MLSNPSQLYYNNPQTNNLEDGYSMSNIGHVRYDKKGKTWYVELWLNGKHHRLYRLPIAGGELVSCKTENMAQTLKFTINRQIDQEIFYPERFKKKQPLHLKAYAETWLSKQDHLMNATKIAYKQYINKHLVPVIGHVFINDINEGMLDDLINKLNVAPKSKQNIISCLMKILNDAERHHDIDKAPKKPIMRGTNKVIDPEVIWLEPKEQELIIAKLKPEYRNVIIFMMMTGCRPSEARALQWDDVKFSRGEIIFRNTFDCKEKLVMVKGKRPMPIPIIDDVRILLESIEKTLQPFVFINAFTGRPFSAHLTDVFGTACKRALGYKIGMAKAGRTSFAQQMANNGMEISMLSRFLRHTDTKITKRYYEYKTSSMKSAVDKVRKIR